MTNSLENTLLDDLHDASVAGLQESSAPAVAAKSNDWTTEQVDDMIGKVADKLARATKSGEQANEKRESSSALQSEAYAMAHDYMESLGLPRGEKGGGKVYRENGLYLELQRDLCTALSKKLGDKVETNKRGTQVFSARVSKQFSRMVIAYREDGDGTQSEADLLNKEIAKVKRRHATERSDLLERIVDAYTRAAQDELKGLLDRAKGLLESHAAELAEARG